jgi:small membrane protein
VIIKWLLVPGVILSVVIALRSRASLRGQARRKILAFLTVVAGVAAVMFPGLLQIMADAVGVTRGTDLLVYVLALVILYLVGSTGARFREQESRLTLLARRVALSEAEIRLAELRAEELIDSRPAPAADSGRAVSRA